MLHKHGNVGEFTSEILNMQMEWNWVNDAYVLKDWRCRGKDIAARGAVKTAFKSGGETAAPKLSMTYALKQG